MGVSKKLIYKLRELGYYSYSEYLKSDIWKQKRAAYIKSRGNFACDICQKLGKFHIHHVRYNTLGNEDFHDLSLLCADCHQKVDIQFEVYPRMGLYGAAKKTKRKINRWKRNNRIDIKSQGQLNKERREREQEYKKLVIEHYKDLKNSY